MASPDARLFGNDVALVVDASPLVDVDAVAAHVVRVEEGAELSAEDQVAFPSYTARANL